MDLLHGEEVECGDFPCLSLLGHDDALAHSTASHVIAIAIGSHDNIIAITAA